MYETNKRDYTLGEWLDTWLEEIAPTKRKPNTISIYRDARRRLLTHHPEAAGILLVELNALQVEGWLDSMRQKYEVNAAPYPRYAESSIQIRNKGT